MRVAIVSLYADQQRSDGATQRLRRVAEGLAATGHDVVWCCAKWWEGPIREFEQNGVEYVAVAETPAVRTFTSKLPFVLRRLSPDVIHCANSPPSQVVAAKTASRFLRVPVVVDWWAEREGDTGRMARRAASGADHVIVPSRLVKTEARERGASTESITLIPESVDFELIREADTEARTDVVYARRIDDHANVESFLLALAELRDRDWRAVVIGDGPERGAAEQTAADLRIDDRVRFLGDLDPEEFVPILKGARVFAQTATVEPFARELLWALACGCVGIVEYQARSSAHELVENFDRGARVTSPQELAAEVAAASTYEPASINESFVDYDHETVLQSYVHRYESAIDEYGFF